MAKKILYLFSDTGGGHRASTNALIAAVNKIHPETKQEMIDVFAECNAFLNIFAKLYGPITKYSPKLWGKLYNFLNDPKKLKTLENTAVPLIKDELAERIKLIKPDIIVSLHPMTNHIVVKSVRDLKKDIPIITVVLDPFTFHPAWICPDVNLLIVATKEAKKLALEYGMPKNKIKVFGIPIDPRFLEKKNKKDARRILELKKNLPTVLMMGGGEGSGGMGRIIKKIEENIKNIQLIVVCGRNKRLENRLKEQSFQIPIKIFGFTYGIPLLMDASDMIITKGGPGSIAEAMAKNLPMIITSWLPGQEEGNIEFVKSAQIGYVETKPGKIATLVNYMMKGNDVEKFRKNIKTVSRPNASINIAKTIVSYILIFLFLIATPSYAFKDVAKKHWAEKYINKLVELGVTQGYPDGTFRGKKKIDRFQVASFLNNLSKKFDVDQNTKKLIAELKTELAVQKYRIKKPQNMTLSGKIEGNLLLSQTNGRSLLNNYRGRFSLDNNRVRIGIDTLDQGFNNAEDLIEIDANFKFSELNFKLGFGPGDIIHGNTLIPYLDGSVFRKNQPNIIATVAKNHVRMEAGYTILNNQTNGLVSDHDITIGLGHSGKIVRLHYIKGTARDIRGEIKVDYRPLKLNIGAGSGKLSGLYVGLEVNHKPIKISVKKVGSQFVTRTNLYSFLPLNMINKYVLPGTTDIAILYERPISKNITTRVLVDLVLAGNSEISRTTEFDLIFSQSEKAKTSLFYAGTARSDVLGLGLEIVL